MTAATPTDHGSGGGPEVLYDVDGHIATITLNRPHRRNAISIPMLVQLGAAFERVDRDRGVRVAILTGAGAGFCSGLDIKDAVAGTGIGGGGGLSAGGGSLSHTSDLPTVTLQEMDKPVIAALNGAAAGYGFDLALGCDLRLAAASARILPGFAKRAIVPRAAVPGISRGSSAGRRRRRSPTSDVTSPPSRPRTTASSTRWSLTPTSWT